MRLSGLLSMTHLKSHLEQFPCPPFVNHISRCFYSTGTCTRVKINHGDPDLWSQLLLDSRTVDASLSFLLFLWSVFGFTVILCCRFLNCLFIFFLEKYEHMQTTRNFGMIKWINIIYITHMGCLNKIPLYDRPKFAYLLIVSPPYLCEGASGIHSKLPILVMCPPARWNPFYWILYPATHNS